MPRIRKWLDKGNVSSSRMPELLALLVRQARAAQPITYGEVAFELGMHHRPVHYIAGYIGFTLREVAKLKAWRSCAPPPIHSLIVNDITRLPGVGIDGFMSDAYQDAHDDDARRAVLKAIHARVKDYEHWSELCELLKVPLDVEELSGAVKQAMRASARGGEGPEHLALKLHVRDNPDLVGLAPGSKIGETEYKTAAGDRIDVMFKRSKLRLAVEVKPAHSKEDDLLRGIFQCLKYRAVLEAQAALEGKHVGTKVLLLLGGTATPKVVKVAHSLGIDFMENVRAGDVVAQGDRGLRKHTSAIRVT